MAHQSGGSSGDLTSGDELEQQVQPEPSVKKSKSSMNPFKKVKRFFSNRKRDRPGGKGGDHGRIGYRARSTNDVLSGDDDSLSHLGSNKTLSMSADSVFSKDLSPRDMNPTPGRSPAVNPSARSMETLPLKTALNNDLLDMFKNKKSRKNREEDGGRSGDLRRNRIGGSEDSLGSMDEIGIEEDFFSKRWSVATHSTTAAPASRSKQKLDLNSVTTTKALSNEGAKHKLALKQNKRPRSQFRSGRRPRSPGAPVPISPLAKVSEEEPKPIAESPKAESLIASDTEDLAPAADKDEELEKRKSLFPPKSTGKRASRDTDSEAEGEEGEAAGGVGPKPVVHTITPEIHEVKPEVKPEVKKEVKPEVKADPKVEENKENVEPEVVKAEPPKVETKPEEEPKKEELPPVKKEVEPKKEIPKKDEDPAPSNPFGVVKLRSTGKRTNLDAHGTLRVDKAKDATKRQTIAGDSVTASVFGSSKVAQRSSVHEPKDWEKLELEAKAKKEPEPEADATGNSEFSKVFSKLKKRNSTSITALVEADQKSPDHSPVKESKPFVSDAKPAVNREAKPVVPKDETPKAEPKRDSVGKEEPKPKRPDEPKSEPKAEVPKTERPRSISPGATDSNKKTEKPDVVAEKPKDLGKEPFKRDSPILRDRERSKTIGTPEMAQKNETKSSPVVKRTHSQKVTPSTTTTTTTPTTTSNTPQTTEPEKRPVLKTASKLEPKKPESSSSNTGGCGGGQPSWIAMARKKTTTWDENRDPEKELKEASNKAKKEDDDENRKSKVMDLMKNFQNK